MFGWASRNLENMLWFSFLFVLSLLLLMVIASPAEAQVLRKKKSLGPVPQCTECHRWCKECSELDMTGRALCLHHWRHFIFIKTWQNAMVFIEKMGLQFPFFCSFSFRVCLWGLHVGVEFCVCLIEIFVPTICKNFLPSEFPSQFTSQIAQTKIGHKAPWRSNYSNNFLCPVHSLSPDEVTPVPCQWLLTLKPRSPLMCDSLNTETRFITEWILSFI